MRPPVPQQPGVLLLWAAGKNRPGAGGPAKFNANGGAAIRPSFATRIDQRLGPKR